MELWCNKCDYEFKPEDITDSKNVICPKCRTIHELYEDIDEDEDGNVYVESWLVEKGR